MRHSRLMLLAAMTGLAAEAQAQEDEPDLSFLEYLGSWQESDEEWLIVAEMEEALVEHDPAEHDGAEHDGASSGDDAEVLDEATDETDETDESDGK